MKSKLKEALGKISIICSKELKMIQPHIALNISEILLCRPFSVFVWVHVLVCVSACMCMCSMEARRQTTLQVGPWEKNPSLKQCLSMTCSSLDWLASGFQRSSYLCQPISGITGVCHQTRHFYVGSGDRTQTLSLQGKHFPDSTMSQPSRLVF